MLIFTDFALSLYVTSPHTTAEVSFIAQTAKGPDSIAIELLKRKVIEFEPPLSDLKQLAISQISTEPATKYIYGFSERLWEPKMTYMCHTGLFPR